MSRQAAASVTDHHYSAKNQGSQCKNKNKLKKPTNQKNHKSHKYNDQNYWHDFNN